jgi:putative spermidine/putrescine transport system substrate-binding protein
LRVPPDNKNSGQSLAALIAEKANPVADVVYLGGQVGPQAREAGVLAAYKPQRWNDIPATLKDPDGYWFTIHSGTLGLFVNKAALRGKPVPASWKELLKPEYKGLVGYLNPASAAVGQVGVVAVNLALAGSYEKLAAALHAAHQVALDIDPDAADDYVLEPPAYQLHWWSGGQLITHTAYVGDFPGPYPFRVGGKLID